MSKDIKEVLEMHARMIKGDRVSLCEAKSTAIAEIKRIIEEAKPKYASGYNKGIEHYHNNLLKALGE